MADDEQAIVPSGPETATAPEAITTTETDETSRIPEPGEQASPEDDEGGQPPVDEFDDYEYDGKTFKAPKALRERLAQLDNMDKDYTTKSQSNAELRKALETREAQIEERFKATDEELSLRAQTRHVESELERFKDFGWQQYQEALRTDPLGAQEAWAYVQNLRETKAGLSDQIKQMEGKRTEFAQQDFAKRVQETLAEATKIIPGSTPETVGKTIAELATWAHSRGVSEQALKANWSPVLLELLYDAKLGNGLRTRQAAAPKPPQNTPPQPLKMIGGGKPAATSSDLASLDMEAYVAARRKGVGGKSAY